MCHGFRMFQTPASIIEYVGEERLVAALRVQADTVKRARRCGEKLPASWYDTCERLAGRPMPRELFRFKG